MQDIEKSQLESVESKLLLICETPHFVEYLIGHDIYPDIIAFDVQKITDILAYIAIDTAGVRHELDVLLVIQGLTEYKLIDVYALINGLESNKSLFKSITILSNIDLGKIKQTYYLYGGDLMYGDVLKVENSVKFSVDENDSEHQDKKSNSKVNKATKQKSDKDRINPIMSRFKVYSCKIDKSLKTHGKRAKEIANETDGSMLNQQDFVFVNVFKK